MDDDRHRDTALSLLLLTGGDDGADRSFDDDRPDADCSFDDDRSDADGSFDDRAFEPTGGVRDGVRDGVGCTKFVSDRASSSASKYASDAERLSWCSSHANTFTPGMRLLTFSV